MSSTQLFEISNLVAGKINFFDFWAQISRFASKGKVASTLVQLLSVLTNRKQIDRIQKFANENGLDSDEFVAAALKNARFNLEWDHKNLPIIKSVVQKMHLNVE